MNKVTKVLLGVIVVLLIVIGFGMKELFSRKKADERLVREKKEVERLIEELNSFEDEGLISNLVEKDGTFIFEIEEDKEVRLKSDLFHSVSSTLAESERVEFINNMDKSVFAYEYTYIYHPKLAILIDDVGMNTRVAHEFNDLDMKLNFAVLPFLPRSKEAGDILREAGHTTILHMPMEGSNKTLNDRTDGMIYETDTPKRIFDNFDKSLESVGAVKGFNNHMGSVFTSNEEQMRTILQYAKNKGMYFIDSNTSRRNKGYDVAKELGIPTFQCSHFLDNSKEVADIEKEIARALEMAKEKGEVLVIGHYISPTAEALLNSKELIEKSGVKLVYIEEILE